VNMALRALVLLSVATLVSAGCGPSEGADSSSIYPDGHFDHVSKPNKDDFEDTVKMNVDAGKTMFVRWIASEG